MTLNLGLNAPSGSQAAGLQWTVAYSPADFSGISIAAGSATTAAGKSLSCNNVAGSMTCLVFGLNATTISTGVLATVTLTLSATTSNTSSAVQISNPVASTAGGAAIPITASGAIVTITQPVPPPPPPAPTPPPTPPPPAPPPTPTGSIPVTVQTSTPGASFVVDGATYTSTQVLNWVPGSSHTLSAAPSQSGGAGIQYEWSSWSDGGLITHTVSPSSATTYTAGFTTQYYLTTGVSPAGSGTINPGSGWYTRGTTASVSATANTGYTFAGFSGALSGTTIPQAVTMTAPQSVSANFQPPTTTGGTAFIAAYSSAGRILRNNFSGWVGTQFTVGAAALNVTSVGRLCLYGNTGTHTVKFAGAAAGQDVPGGSATVNMAGCTPGQFVYTALPAPIVLLAGASYYLASMEVSGGDSWYDVGPVTTTSGGTVTNSVYNNGLWIGMSSANTSYVPPNFLYSSAGLPSVPINGVLNAASYTKTANGQGTAVAPGSLVQIYAALPGATTSVATSAPFPTSLAGVSVTFNGTRAPLSAVLPNSTYPVINAQVPFEVLTSGTSTTANVITTVNGVSSAPLQVPITWSAPGIFTTSENGQGQAILVNLANLQIATPSNPVPRSGTAFFYATGLGALQPTVGDGAASPASPAVSTPIVLVGGIAAPVLFAGQAPGYPGVNQINIIIPASAPTGSAVPLQVQTTDGSVTTSTLVTIAIQ